MLRRLNPKPKLDWADRAILAALTGATPQALEDEAGYAGDAAALAPAVDPPALGLSPPQRQAAIGLADRGADRADGAGEPGLGLQVDPG